MSEIIEKLCSCQRIYRVARLVIRHGVARRIYSPKNYCILLIETKRYIWKFLRDAFCPLRSIIDNDLRTVCLE